MAKICSFLSNTLRRFKYLSFVLDTAWLMVTLADKNDRSPRFLSPYYRATLMEGPCDTNTSLLHLKATDDDLDQANTEFTIVPGSNPNNLFQLRDTSNTSTNLYCSGTIDRETTPDLKVVIQARDKAYPKPYLSGTYMHLYMVLYIGYLP